MPKKIVRQLKAEFGPRKKALPLTLRFLDRVQYHAITVDRSGPKKTTVVEMKPVSLRRLVNERDAGIKNLTQSAESVTLEKARANKLAEDVQDLQQRLSDAEAENQKLKEENDRLNMNLKRIEENDRNPDHPDPRSNMKIYPQVAEERGFEPRGRPFQGGLPS